MKVIESWEINDNFWKINPQLVFPEAFNKIFRSDTSKNKVKSSQLMWAIALYCDVDSKYRQVSDKEKKTLIATDYLKAPDFPWDDFKEQIEAWEMFKPVAIRQLMEWERFMNEKTIYMRELKYDANNRKDIEEMLLSNTKLYKEYEDIKKRIAEIENAGTLEGGGQESFLEIEG